jgi:hypothetical protein
MKENKGRFAAVYKRKATVAAITLLVAGKVAAAPARRTTTLPASTDNQVRKTESKFYCNIQALTPEERLHHKQLTDKLMSAREEIVEMEKGYEFQFSPRNVTLTELADWVVKESKCCPFFDFHLDLENEGKLVCLRLTGEKGIKQFIRAEFQIR